MTLDELIEELMVIRARLDHDAPVRLSIREGATVMSRVDTLTGLRVSAKHFSILAAKIEEGLYGPIVIVESGEHAADVM